jgi:hypothetical protein
MQSELGGMLHHLSFGGRTLCVDEDRVVSSRGAECRQVAGLQRIQARTFLSHDLFLQRVYARSRSRCRTPCLLRLSVADCYHHE